MPISDEQLKKQERIRLRQFRESEKIAADMVVILGHYDKDKNEDFINRLQKNLTKISGSFKKSENFYGMSIRNIERITRCRLRTPRRLLHNWISTCGFVIADDSIPSGVLAELEHCRNCGTITAIISRPEKKGELYRRASFMTLDHDIHSEDFKEIKYAGSITNGREIQKMLKEKVIPFFRKRRKRVERKMREKQKEYDAKKKKVIN